MSLPAPSTHQTNTPTSQDDWYILDYEPQQFIAVYYRGRNDAWNGYGGAVVYTRQSTVPAKYKGTCVLIIIIIII